MSEELHHQRGEAALDAAGLLADPVRRRLHALVAEATDPVSRDDAAAAVGVGRSAAGYHLDQLVDAGLLTAGRERRTGRSGPGAGRPAKVYGPAPVEVTVQLPPRDDTLVARLLAEAVETDPSGKARQALREVTRAAGRDLAQQLPEASARSLVAELRDRGYAPIERSEGVRLRNCPFHHLVDDHRDLVCSLNEDLLGAAAEAAGVGLRAVLDPQPGQCCVLLVDAGAPDAGRHDALQHPH